MNNLPDGVILEIMRALPGFSKVNFIQVCRRFWEVFRDYRRALNKIRIRFNGLYHIVIYNDDLTYSIKIDVGDVIEIVNCNFTDSKIWEIASKNLYIDILDNNCGIEVHSNIIFSIDINKYDIYHINKVFAIPRVKNSTITISTGVKWVYRPEAYQKMLKDLEKWPNMPTEFIKRLSGIFKALDTLIESWR